jgi:hypothetical protein
MMKRIAFAALCLFAVLCISAQVVFSADLMKREFEKIVPLRSGGSLELTNVTGSVTVTGWDREEVRVRAVMTCDLEKSDDEARELFEQVEIEVENNWNNVHVKTKYPDSDWDSDDRPDLDFDFEIGDDGEESGAFERNIVGLVGRVVGGVTGWITGLVRDELPVEVNYEIYVPADCGMELKTVTGDVLISGVQGDIESSLVTGNTAIVDASGDLDCSAVTGNIEIERASGKLRTAVITGNVTISFAREGNIYGVHCSVVNGDIVLRVPEDKGMDFTLNTVNGDIDLKLDALRDAMFRGKRFKGSVAGGGPDIEANAVNGSVRVERSER